MKIISTQLGNFMLMHNAEYILLVLGAVILGIYIGWVFTWLYFDAKIKKLEVKSMTDKEIVKKIREKYE